MIPKPVNPVIPRAGKRQTKSLGYGTVIQVH